MRELHRRFGPGFRIPTWKANVAFESPHSRDLFISGNFGTVFSNPHVDLETQCCFRNPTFSGALHLLFLDCVCRKVFESPCGFEKPMLISKPHILGSSSLVAFGLRLSESFQNPMWIWKPNVDFETPHSRDLFISGSFWTAFVERFSNPHVHLETQC
jgi:hypothetical protein